MYTTKNYRSTKELCQDFLAGIPIDVYQPGPFGPLAKDGKAVIEGPHYPAPHSFYLEVFVQGGRITEILNKATLRRVKATMAKEGTK